MAYSSTNPPAVIAGPLTGRRIWWYESSDVSTAIDDADYFTNGYSLGMRVGDVVFGAVSSSYNLSIGRVSVASSSGPCTVIYGGLVST